MVLQRQPAARLHPFIARLWATEGDAQAQASGPLWREHVLPTGLMHVVFRLDASRLYFVDPLHSQRSAAPASLVGGARSSFYEREFDTTSCSVGAVLWPGTAALLFGAGADELAHRHTALEDLWGHRATSVHAELCELRTAADRMARLELRLGERLPLLRGLDPQVADLLNSLSSAASVGDAVRTSGLSHRRFIADFRHAVGLAPKAYLQLQRFQGALRAMRSDPVPALADVAALAGYSDQSHFGREFLEFAGVTPAQYCTRKPADTNHVPIAP
jgi:AraC-like DNA-binding protein